MREDRAHSNEHYPSLQLPSSSTASIKNNLIGERARPTNNNNKRPKIHFYSSSDSGFEADLDFEDNNEIEEMEKLQSNFKDENKDEFIIHSDVFKLNPNIVFNVLDYLDPRSLSRFSRTCVAFYNFVTRYLGLLGASWDKFDVQRAPGFPHHGRLQPIVDEVSVSPSEVSKIENLDPEDLPEIFPPAFGHQAATQIGNALYLPYLSVNPSVYVLNLTTRLWDRKFLKIKKDENFKNTFKSSEWKPLMAPVTAYKNDTLYIFGGTHHPKISSDHPIEPITDDRSKSVLSDVLYKIDINDWSIEEIGSSNLLNNYKNDNRSVDSNENSYELIWPKAREGHTLATVDDKLILFGGLTENSIGENDVFVYNILENQWNQPEIKGFAPDVRFGHSQVVHGNDIFYFGGAQVDDPVNVIFDDLNRLHYNRSNESYQWYNYKSPEAYSRKRSFKLKERRVLESNNNIDGRRVDNNAMQTDDDINNLKRVYSSDDELESLYNITTSGQPPRERLESTMVLVGSHKLAIFAGLTIVPASYEYEAYDEYCAYNTAAIDVFDFRHNHWSRVDVRGSGKAKNTFIVESCCAYIAPPETKFGEISRSDEQDYWQFIVIGHRLHWDDFEVSICTNNSDGSSDQLFINTSEDKGEDSSLKLVSNSGDITSIDPKKGLNVSKLANEEGGLILEGGKTLSKEELSQALASQNVAIHGISTGPNQLQKERTSSSSSSNGNSLHNQQINNFSYGPTGARVKPAAVGTVQKTPTGIRKTGGISRKKKAKQKGSWMTFYSRNDQVILASTTARRRKLTSDESSPNDDVSPMSESSGSVIMNDNDEPDEITKSFGYSNVRSTRGKRSSSNYANVNNENSSSPIYDDNSSSSSDIYFLSTVGFVKSLSFER